MLQEAVEGFLLRNKETLSNDPSEDPAFMQALPSHVIDAMQLLISINKTQHHGPEQEDTEDPLTGLPNRIVFPYARHSSLPELRHLVSILKPRDVWPCTFDFASWERKGFTIQSLFGDCCSGNSFAHDLLMEQMRDSQMKDGAESSVPEDTQRTTSSCRLMTSSPVQPSSGTTELIEPTILNGTIIPPHVPHAVEATREVQQLNSQSAEPPPLPEKRNREAFHEDSEDPSQRNEELDLQDDSQASTLSTTAYETRLGAFKAAESMMNGGAWCPIGLISTTDHHTVPEEDLGA